MLSIVLLTVFQSKTLNYEIQREGKVIGTAKAFVKITTDGGKRTDTKLILAQGTQKLDLHTTQVWATSGRPLLKIVLILNEKGEETSRTRVDFRTTDVLVTKTVGSKITKSTVAVPAKGEIRDLPEFWFLRDQPVVGKAFSYFAFNATTLTWDNATSIYKGDKKENASKLHHISQKIGKRSIELLLDQDGFPVETTASDGTRIIAK
jgi:hypothetical protein